MIGTIVFEILGFVSIIPLVEVGMKVGEPSEIGIIFGKTLDYFKIEKKLPNILLIIILMFISKALMIFILNLIKARSTLNLRLKIQSKIIHDIKQINLLEMNKLSSGYWINILNRETERMVSAYGAYIRFLADFISSFSLLFVVITLQPEVLTFMIIFSLPAIFILLFLMKKTASLSFLYSEHYEKSCKFIVEFIQQNQYLRIVNEVNKFGFKVRSSFYAFARAEWILYIISTTSTIIKEPLAVLILASIIYFNAIRGEVSLAEIALIYIILYRLVGYVINLIQVLQSLISMIASIFKINKLFALNIRKNIVKSINEKYLFNNWKEIRLNNVSYSVSKKIILSNINFKIKSNEITGIIGPSGSGKTSLMLLLTRILNPTCGNILIDQKPIEMFKKNEFNSNIGYVGQNISTFDDNIINNITLWDDSLDEKRRFDKVNKILDMVNLSEFKCRLGDNIGENGVNISGGQKQRIALARELYRKPNLLILDEATSSLDPLTEKDILNTISKLKMKLTIIMVTHNMKNLKFFDNTFIIKNGKINEYKK